MLLGEVDIKLNDLIELSEIERVYNVALTCYCSHEYSSRMAKDLERCGFE